MVTTSAEGSTYVPMDSWIYPALDRLHGLGYLDTAFLGIRPWTRLSIAHMLQQSSDRIDSDTNNDEAKEIYLAVLREVQPDIDNASELNHPSAELDSVYEQARGISGTSLRDSFHLGQTIVNDYGRPYEPGFNNYAGFSARAEAGRFTLYYRGEYEYAPSAPGYSPTLYSYLSCTVDDIAVNASGVCTPTPNQRTIPGGPIATATNARLMEATISYHLLGHEVSFGKRRGDALEQQRSGHLSVPDRSRGADACVAVVAAYGAVPLRFFRWQPEGAYRSKRSVGAHGEGQLQTHEESRVRV